jgi:hypothetical protein
VEISTILVLSFLIVLFIIVFITVLWQH